MTTPLILTVFITIFLAELGDKTQLATVALSGSSNKPLAVFLGSSAALIMASFLGALAGGSISTVFPEELIKSLAAIGFIIIGLRLLAPILIKNIQKSGPDQG